MTSTRQILDEQKKRIIERLRVREPELVRELEAINSAIANLGPVELPPDIYTPYKSAVDAVIAHLQRVGRTETAAEVVASVVRGGYLRGNRMAEKNVKASVKYHLEEPTEKLKKFPSGRIGLFEWTDGYDQV